MRTIKRCIIVSVASALCSLISSNAYAETAGGIDIGVSVGVGAPSFDGGRSYVTDVVSRRGSVTSTIAVQADVEPMEMVEINHRIPRHKVFVHAAISGGVPTTVSGELSGKTTSWSSSFSASGSGDLEAVGEVFQYFRGRRHRFPCFSL